MKRLTVTVLSIILIFAMGGCSVKEQTPQTDWSMESVQSVSVHESEAEQSTVSEESFAQEESSSAPAEPVPTIVTDKTEYASDEQIRVTFSYTDSKDWVGFYPEGADPGTVNSITWQYAEGEGELTFNASALRDTGTFWVFLCDNDGYLVLDMQTVKVLDGDTNDYGAKSASVSLSVANGYSHTEVTVTPSAGDRLTYALYWAKNGKRLDGYRPIYTCEHEGMEPFTVVLNDCLYMPADADSIEVAVKNGQSVSCFASVGDALKAPASDFLYAFHVITDLHITASRPNHSSHLNMAFEDIIAYGKSGAVFTCGDNTDRGKAEEYDMLLDIVASAGEKLPDIYYAMGNHDLVYGNGYDAQVALFCEKTGMQSSYYSVELDGTRFIVLGSDTAVGEGTVGKEQLAWLKNELAKTDKSKPAFVFLHQPLIETVSGSLYSKDHEIQDWYGIVDTADEIRAMLKDYPNVFFFTGHTHWTLESTQPILAGKGEDATFVNAASVGYLWNDLDAATGGSEGYCVEVYEDYVLLRGREFLYGEWCGAAQFLIPIAE